jgi:predicted ATPase
LAAEKLAADRAAKSGAAEKAAREQIAAERAAADKLAASKALSDKTLGDKAAVVASATFRTAVETRLADFASLWSARRVEPYLALFDPSFPNFTSYAENRRKRMQEATFIEVSISDVSYRETAPGEITARFTQRYRSDKFQSQETKELVWRQTAAGPRIVLERKLR